MRSYPESCWSHHCVSCGKDMHDPHNAPICCSHATNNGEDGEVYIDGFCRACCPTHAVDQFKQRLNALYESISHTLHYEHTPTFTLNQQQMVDVQEFLNTFLYQ